MTAPLTAPSMQMVEYVEYELTPCPSCRGATEISGEIAKNYYLLRCPACGWSQVVRALVLSDEWAWQGQYIAPSVIGAWVPYFPGDPRLRGLAPWQMPKPKILPRDRTEDSQILCVLDTLELAVDCLTAIVSVLHEKEPYISQKAYKLQDHLNRLVPLLPECRKKTPFMLEESGYRVWLYKTMTKSFLPDNLPLNDKGLIPPEELAPYTWGFFGLLWHVWAMMCDCRVNCPLVVGKPGIKALWTAFMQGVEAMCARYNAETAFHRLMRTAAEYRDRNLKPKQRRGKKKLGVRS